jgi:hypothetical protein
MKAISAAGAILNLSIILALLISLFISLSSGQSAPDYQSVSGEFAQKWIKDFENEKTVPVVEVNQTEGNKSRENESDLWSWGKAPRGSEIVDGKLVRDPYYLRPLLNLSSNWLGESYTDSDTGLPIDVYSDPLTGRKYYSYLNPTTGNPFFSYYTYVDEKTGLMVYVYADPTTGEEVHSSSKPVDVIKALASGINAQTF